MEIEPDEFVKDLFREDDLGIVIRVHIHIENLILEYLDLLIPSPDNLKDMNLDFNQRLSLAVAMGLDKDFSKPLKVLGTIRNKFAHNLSTSLDLETVKNLYSALRPEEKEQVQQSFGRLKPQNPALQEISKFSDLPPGDQFRLIVVPLRVALEATIIMIRDKKTSD